VAEDVLELVRVLRARNVLLEDRVSELRARLKAVEKAMEDSILGFFVLKSHISRAAGFENMDSINGPNEKT
jgi:hypothetical protein